jgi:hypothetical protein
MNKSLPADILYSLPNFNGVKTIYNTIQSANNAYLLATKVKLEKFKIYYFRFNSTFNGKFIPILSLPNGCSLIGITLSGFTSSNTAIFNFSGVVIPLSEGIFSGAYSEIGTGGIYFKPGSDQIFVGTENLNVKDFINVQMITLLN